MKPTENEIIEKYHKLIETRISVSALKLLCEWYHEQCQEPENVPCDTCKHTDVKDGFEPCKTCRHGTLSHYEKGQPWKPKDGEPIIFEHTGQVNSGIYNNGKIHFGTFRIASEITPMKPFDASKIGESWE